jgi:hypothetical protein
MLALGISEGSDLYVGQHRIVVDLIRNQQACDITIETDFMTRKFQMVAKKAVAVTPGVNVSIGLPKRKGKGSTGGQITLCVAAPQNIPITRGDLYRKQGGHKKKVA